MFREKANGKRFVESSNGDNLILIDSLDDKFPCFTSPNEAAEQFFSNQTFQSVFERNISQFSSNRNVINNYNHLLI